MGTFHVGASLHLVCGSRTKCVTLSFVEKVLYNFIFRPKCSYWRNWYFYKIYFTRCLCPRFWSRVNWVFHQRIEMILPIWRYVLFYWISFNGVWWANMSKGSVCLYACVYVIELNMIRFWCVLRSVFLIVSNRKLDLL